MTAVLGIVKISNQNDVLSSVRRFMRTDSEPKSEITLYQINFTIFLYIHCCGCKYDKPNLHEHDFIT